MNNKKIIYRHNNEKISSLMEFANKKVNIDNNYRDVYFIRILGVNSSLQNNIKEIDEFLDDSMLNQKLLYKRIDKLSGLLSVEDTEFYINCYENWIKSDKRKMETRISIMDYRLIDVLGNACKEVLDKYLLIKSNATDSIKKNFIVKLLFWFDSIMKDFLVSWNEDCNIKIVADNVYKDQEYLFYYLLTLIGSDVVLIQNKYDIDKNSKLISLTDEIVIGDFGECEIPKYIKKERTYTNKSTVIKQENKTDQNFQKEKIVIHLPERNRNRNQKQYASKVESVVNDRQKQQRREKSLEQLALLASSVVMITMHDRSGQVIGCGSGIMIGRGGYILTNNHVTVKGIFYSVRIEGDDEVYRTDELIKYNSVLDLAIIRIDKKLNPIPIYNGKEKLVRGQKVVAIGSPLGLFNSVSDGIISGFRVIDDVDMIQFTAPISNGSSGGAVVNMYGEVIGISTAGFDAGQNLNLAVGYECINMFIKGFTK